jgi:hypothetical protein
MFTRKWLSAAVVLVVVVVFGQVTATPSQALDFVYISLDPLDPICAQASLTPGVRPAADPGRTPLIVEIEACAGTDPDRVGRARWTLVTYYAAKGIVPRSSTAKYGFETSGPRVLELHGYRDGGLVDPEPSHGLAHAACVVVFGKNPARLACLRLEQVGEAGTVVMTPVPVNDPLFAGKLYTYSPDRYTEPECGACV